MSEITWGFLTPAQQRELQAYWQHYYPNNSNNDRSGDNRVNPSLLKYSLIRIWFEHTGNSRYNTYILTDFGAKVYEDHLVNSGITNYLKKSPDTGSTQWINEQTRSLPPGDKVEEMQKRLDTAAAPTPAASEALHCLICGGYGVIYTGRDSQDNVIGVTCKACNGTGVVAKPAASEAIMAAKFGDDKRYVDSLSDGQFDEYIANKHANEASSATTDTRGEGDEAYLVDQNNLRRFTSLNFIRFPDKEEDVYAINEEVVALWDAYRDAKTALERLTHKLEFLKDPSDVFLEAERECTRQHRDNFMMLYKAVSSKAPDVWSEVKPNLIDTSHEIDKLSSAVTRYQQEKMLHDHTQAALAASQQRVRELEAARKALLSSLDWFVDQSKGDSEEYREELAKAVKLLSDRS